MKNPETNEQWVRAGWLIDGQGGAVRRDAVIGITNGRVTCIQMFDPHHEGHLTAKDFSHATLIPALIDAHVHLALSGTRDPEKRHRQLTPTAAEAQATIALHLAEYRRNGILAVRDGGDRFGHVLAFQNANPARTRLSVKVSATCWAWHARGRYGRMIGRSPEDGTDLPKVLANLSEGMPEGMGHLKLIHSGLNSLDRFGHSGAPQFSFDELHIAVKMAHDAGLPVMVHANGEAAVAGAIRAGCDSIEHGYFMGADNLARLADQGIAWVPTVVPMAVLAGDPSLTGRQHDTALRTRDHQLDQIHRGRRLGVPIVLGTDAGSVGVDHAAAVPMEMGLFREAGLHVAEIVFCATGRAAYLLGLPDRHVIAPGQRADFVVVRGGPDNVVTGLSNADGICINGAWQSMTGDFF
jgi:imidazolonepropionase-like amidohydrolase